MSKAETQKQDRCYAGRGGWQTCTACNGRIHATDCTSPKRPGVDCLGCMPADSGGAARFECWTCANQAVPHLRHVKPYANDVCRTLNHDVRPAEVSR